MLISRHSSRALWAPVSQFLKLLFIAASMAEGVSYAKASSDDQVLLQMAEPTMNPSKQDHLKGLYFESDGSKKVDYVLVYEVCKEKEEKDPEFKDECRKMANLREAFHRSLRHQGLELEEDEFVPPQSPETTRHFVKLHLPWNVLLKGAEKMNLKAPIQPNDIEITPWYTKVPGGETISDLWQNKNPLVVHDGTVIDRPDFFMAPFKREHLTKYLGYQDQATFFSTSDRHYVIQRICYSAKFGEERHDVGLRKLLYDGAYTAAYPLHDGPKNLASPEDTPTNDRQRLKRDWARFGRFFKFQPYEGIKEYFGSEIAMYFAWLGFYTAMLVPLAIIGLLVFLYGIGSATSDPPVKDICSSENKGKWIMCPLCDRQCSYWDLAGSTTACLYVYVTHFFDNQGTLFLALVASIWATLFLEFWKRRQASLAQEWHLSDFEETGEQLRPEYVSTVTTLRRNQVTGKMEPYLPAGVRCRRYSAIFAIIAFMIFLVLAAVVGVVVYRAAIFAVLSANSDATIRGRSRLFTTATAAVLNLLCINLLKIVYNRLAAWLTKWENPRTRTEFEDSFAYKMYMFQFVNTYSSIFYIAFFKSAYVVGTPGRYRRVLDKYRLDSCSQQGCFLELCIQLVIIMVGQQIIGNITEVAIPALMTWIKRRKESDTVDYPRYVRDFDLSPQEEHSMFWEYLEVVLQYGFVTMFIAAFPLAPLFALLNSIAEVRVDAINFVSQFRRPDVTHAEDIGAWSRILEGVTKISVLVNAFVLSFTSEFIPKLVYTWKYAPDRGIDGSLEGYLDNSLAYMSIAHINATEPGTLPENPNLLLNATGLTMCRYRGYFEPTSPFKYSKQYWHVIAARLAMVFLFQFTVSGITAFVAWVVPDVPENLALKQKRESHLAKRKLRGKDDDDSDISDEGDGGNDML